MKSKLIKASIDISKIKKEAITTTDKGGEYINIDIWVSDEEDKFGNTVGIKQSVKVGDGYESHYIGNGKKKFGWDAPEPKIERAEVLPLTPSNDLPF